MVAFEFLNFGIFHQFYLSSNTVWLQVSAFKILGIFDWLLCQRHFRWFSNPVRSWRTFLFYWGSLNLDFRRLIQEVRPPIKVTLIGFNVSPDDPALLLFCNQNSLTAWKYQAWNRSRSSSSMMNRCWLCPSWPHFFTSSLSKQEPRLKLSLIYSTISPQKMNQILLGMLSKQPV